jgi:periplasmic protein TonB
MTAATFQLQDDGNEMLVWRVLKFSFVFGLHVALVVWITHAQFNTPPEPAPIRLDVRTIEVPPPSALVAPKPVTEPPRPLPQTARPVIRRSEPVVSPPVLAAAPSADPAPTTFAMPAPPKAVEPPAEPAPVLVTAARFDADYLQNPAPAYPAMSRKLHEEGKVLLQVKVTATGIAEHVQIKQGSGYPRLDEAALNTVLHWRFIPARRGDEAVAASVIVPIVFRLDG